LITEDQIKTTLRENAISEPVSGIRIENNKVSFILEVDPSDGTRIENIRQQAERCIQAIDRGIECTVIMTSKKSQHGKQATAQYENLCPSVKHIIAVASGKGGVGKSTVAVNLAQALSKAGLKTGIMDADIYGPSIPKMFNLKKKPVTRDDKIVPPKAGELSLMSIGFMIEEETPMIWRGPMIQSALKQFLQDVDWGDLDILVVDMPPGTGDAQLTMAQKVPLSGVVIVSTPQDLALIDARKGIEMFSKVNVPIIGLIENMSMFSCPACGHRTDIFGHDGARKQAETLSIPFLGNIDLDISIRESCDEGTPFVLQNPDHDITGQFDRIAEDINKTLFGNPSLSQAL
jgi:ATP-binding protein involved in chromosome partitioning